MSQNVQEKIDDQTLARLEAKRRVQACLDKIQRAQDLLSSAAGDLCSIQHASSTWKKVGDMYDKVHALWYKVEPLIHSSRIKLDPDALRCFKERIQKKNLPEF